MRSKLGIIEIERVGHASERELKRSSAFFLLSPLSSKSEKMSSTLSFRSMEHALSRSLYRAVLRFAKYSHGVPFSLSASEVRAAVPILERARDEEERDANDDRTNENLDRLRRRLDSALEQHHASSSWDSSALVRKAARIAAEAGGEALLSEKDKEEESLDAAFRSLASLNGQHFRSVSAARSSRAAHFRKEEEKNNLPKYKIGEVFVHKKFGYRAVIIGWDKECAKGPEWARAVGASTANQPFYSCLPSEDDCVSIFGAARSSKYVAEENVDVDSGSLPEGGARVTHPLLRSFFDGWSDEGGEEGGGEEGGEERRGSEGCGGGGRGRGRGRYLGNERLRYEFPDDFSDEGSRASEGGSSSFSAAAVADDSNLLLSDGEREERRRQRRRRGRKGGEEEEAASASASSASSSAPASAATPVEPAAAVGGGGGAER